MCLTRSYAHTRLRYLSRPYAQTGLRSPSRALCPYIHVSMHLSWPTSPTEPSSLRTLVRRRFAHKWSLVCAKTGRLSRWAGPGLDWMDQPIIGICNPGSRCSAYCYSFVVGSSSSVIKKCWEKCCFFCTGWLSPKMRRNDAPATKPTTQNNDIQLKHTGKGSLFGCVSQNKTDEDLQSHKTTFLLLHLPSPHEHVTNTWKHHRILRLPRTGLQKRDPFVNKQPSISSLGALDWPGQGTTNSFASVIFGGNQKGPQTCSP